MPGTSCLGPIIVVIAVCTLLPSPAATCGPCTCPGDARVLVFPEGGDIPENTVFFVWVPEQEPDGIQLIRDSASGARTEVEATIEPGGAADTYTLRPDAPLAAEETYQLVVQGARGSGFSVGTYTIRRHRHDAADFGSDRCRGLRPDG